MFDRVAFPDDVSLPLNLEMCFFNFRTNKYFSVILLRSVYQMIKIPCYYTAL